MLAVPSPWPAQLLKLYQDIAGDTAGTGDTDMGRLEGTQDSTIGYTVTEGSTIVIHMGTTEVIGYNTHTNAMPNKKGTMWCQARRWTGSYQLN